MLIDTHAHYDGEEFADDLDEAVQRAKASGVEKILVPNVNPATWPRVSEICDIYPDTFFPMIGLHPEDVLPEQYNINKVLSEMEQTLATDKRIIAVGEVGLDFYWDETYRAEQIDVFEQQVEWARKYGLPLMIHCRKAHNELIEILKKHRGHELRGVFHCFTGSPEMARQLLTFEGFMLGIGGVLTFKNSKLPETLLDAVPLERIVLETDSPYMAPVPHRGKRNESSFVPIIAQRLAEVYAVNIDEVARVTTTNAENMFLHGSFSS